MSSRSSTAPAGNFLPVSIVVSLIVLIAMLFVVIQTENLPIFPASKSAPYGAVRAPLFRGLVHIPLFRFLPLFRSAVPDIEEEESHMSPSERIDRWEPFIKEASDRYSLPENWIRTIIHIESGGRTMLLGRPITSGAGAMGVMQLMHDTYNEMSVRYSLGSDPYNVHDNILAGTAYLRELYGRYGYPRLFAAYNAGPGVLEAHTQHGAKLPVETQNYVRLALTGTTTVELATKLMAQFLPKPAKASRAKVTRTAANESKPVHVATAHSTAKTTLIAVEETAAKPVHAAKTHSAAKTMLVAVEEPAAEPVHTAATDSAAKTMLVAVEEPAAVPVNTAADDSAAKTTLVAVEETAAEPVHVAAVHSAERVAAHMSAAKPVHTAAAHSSAKPMLVAARVAPRTQHASATHAAHRRVKAA